MIVMRCGNSQRIILVIKSSARKGALFYIREIHVEPFCIDAAYSRGGSDDFSTVEFMGMRMLPVLLMLGVTSGQALDAERLMPELTWEKRVLLVFAPNGEEPGARHQDAILEAIDSGLIERDMTVIRVFADNRVYIDGQSHEQSAASFYQRFGVNSDQFRVILVGKDGDVKLDQSSTVAGNDLFGLIDSMPMRRDEMQSDE